MSQEVRDRVHQAQARQADEEQEVREQVEVPEEVLEEVLEVPEEVLEAAVLPEEEALRLETLEEEVRQVQVVEALEGEELEVQEQAEVLNEL